MIRNFLIIALAAGMTACASDAVSDVTDAASDAVSNTQDNVTELERLGQERSDFYDKQIEALGDGDMEASNKFKAQSDSVDALYKKALGM